MATSLWRVLIYQAHHCSHWADVDTRSGSGCVYYIIIEKQHLTVSVQELQGKLCKSTYRSVSTFKTFILVVCQNWNFRLYIYTDAQNCLIPVIILFYKQWAQTDQSTVCLPASWISNKCNNIKKKVKIFFPLLSSVNEQLLITLLFTGFRCFPFFIRFSPCVGNKLVLYSTQNMSGCFRH